MEIFKSIFDKIINFKNLINFIKKRKIIYKNFKKKGKYIYFTKNRKIQLFNNITL